MKDEIDISRCATFPEVKVAIDDWEDYYNQIARNGSLRNLLQTSITDTLVPVFTNSKPLLNKTYRKLDGGSAPQPPRFTLLFRGGSEKAVRPQAHCLPQTRYDARVAPQRCPILHTGKAFLLYYSMLILKMHL